MLETSIRRMNPKSFIPTIDETEKHAAWALYMGGFDAGEITAQLTDLNINTLKSWISQDGWAKERQAVNAARAAKNPPHESPMVKVFAPDKKAENVKIFKEKTGEIAAADAKHWAEEMKPKDRLNAAEKIAALNKAHRSNLDLDAEAPGERGHISLTFLSNPDAVRVIQSPAPKQLHLEESEL